MIIFCKVTSFFSLYIFFVINDTKIELKKLFRDEICYLGTKFTFYRFQSEYFLYLCSEIFSYE